MYRFGANDQQQQELQQLREEVEQSKKNLAEVIDECVFSETQRLQAETALKAAMTQVTLDRELLQCIDSLLVYVNSIEQEVLLPSLNNVSSIVSSTQNGGNARRDVEGKLESLNQVLAATDASYGTKRGLAQLEGPSSAASQAAVRRQQLLSAPPVVSSIEDCYCMMLAMMSNTQFAKACMHEVADSLNKKLQPPASESSASSAVAMHKHARDLMDQALSFTSDGSSGPVGALVDRVRELEQQVRENELERNEVAQRFQLLQRAVAAAKDAERLREREASLLDEVAVLQLQNQNQAETIRTQQEELLAVTKDLREAKRDHEEQIAKLKRQLMETVKHQSSTDTDSFLTKAQGGSVRDLLGDTLGGGASSSAMVLRPDVVTYQTKLRAFELTVADLNAQLAQLEENVIALERKSDDDQRDAQRSIAELKRQHKEEMEECDNVVVRMTTELESLIKENALLKQKLRKLTQSQPQVTK